MLAIFVLQTYNVSRLFRFYNLTADSCLLFPGETL